jgi:hypothetical protein
MKTGRIIETATPERLFKSPKTVSGATIFPGSQAIACKPAADGVETAFGNIAGIVRPADAAFVVIHEGGVAAVPSNGGAIRVVDCRFAGPDWLVSLASPATPGKVLKARSAAPMESGTAAEIAVSPAFVRILAA